MRIGAIDIGSNSLLLTLVETEGTHGFKILSDECHVTGLSKGLLAQGEITSESLSRSLKVFTHFRNQLQKYKPHIVKVAATEALRRAKNGPAVKEKIEEILQYPVELISGEREAELSFWSVQNDAAGPGPKVVFDIGGASTEVCLGSEKGIEHRESVKIGSVILTEKFSLQDQSNPEAAIHFVQDLLKDLSWAKVPLGIGVAGTITSLFAIELAVDPYDRNRVHRKKISKQRLEALTLELANMSLSARKSVKGLQPDRADVFIGGLSIACALARHASWSEILCMDSGIRFGLIYEALSNRPHS